MATPHDRLTLSARMLACTMMLRKPFTCADLQLHALNVRTSHCNEKTDDVQSDHWKRMTGRKVRFRYQSRCVSKWYRVEGCKRKDAAALLIPLVARQKPRLDIDVSTSSISYPDVPSKPDGIHKSLIVNV